MHPELMSWEKRRRLPLLDQATLPFPKIFFPGDCWDDFPSQSLEIAESLNPSQSLWAEIKEHDSPQRDEK